MPWWGRALAMMRQPVPAYGVIAAFVIPLVLWSVARPPVPPPHAPVSDSPLSAAPTPDVATVGEVPPPRVVGYDARSIVPAPVF